MPQFSQNMQIGGRAFSLHFDLDPGQVSNANIIDAVAGNRLYEPDVAIFLLRTLRPGDTFVDIGANVGYFSVLAAHMVGPDGAVLAAEPDPTNFDRLRRNTALNAGPAFHLVNAPVAQAVETREFFTNKDDSGGHALWDPGLYPLNEKSKAAPESRKVETTTLDTLIAESGRRPPKLIKIDTEGAEYLVLQGASRTLTADPKPLVICELHSMGLQALGASPEKLRELMRGLGYATFVLPKTGNLPWFIPDGTKIGSRYFLNLLFAPPDALAAYFPGVDIDPGTLP